MNRKSPTISRGRLKNMGPVYVTREDAFLGKNDERLTVKASKETILDVPLLNVDGVVLFGRGSTLSCAGA
jgi:CRISPR/Cas system-associated endonuclease Cas1